MKNITNILLVFCLCVSGIITSQNERSLNELLEILSENHMGSVTDVFTFEEIQTIKNHFSETNMFIEEERVLLNRRYSSSESVATPINAVDINPDSIDSIDLLSITPMTSFPGAGVNLRGVGPPRVLVFDNDNNVWRRDPGMDPGIITNLGILLGVPAGHSITGIEVLPGPNSEVYGTSTNGVDESFLLAIDPTNLTATIVGGNNGLVLPIALARDAANRLITIDIDDDNVYSMDKNSGVVSLIGPVGYDANFGQGLCYDQFSDKVVSLAYNAAVGDSQMRYIDPITGMSTVVGVIQPGTVQQFGWASTYDRDEVLGVNENGVDGFEFYPNPAQNYISINAFNSIETIEVYSILGQLKIKRNIDSINGQVDLSALQKGTYILNVITRNQTGSYKLIKK